MGIKVNTVRSFFDHGPQVSIDVLAELTHEANEYCQKRAGEIIGNFEEDNKNRQDQTWKPRKRITARHSQKTREHDG